MPRISKNSKQPNCSTCLYGQYVTEIQDQSFRATRSKPPPISTEYLCTHPDEATANDYNKRLSEFFPCPDAKQR